MMNSTPTFVTDTGRESTNQIMYTTDKNLNVISGESISSWDIIYMIIQISVGTVGILMNILTIIALSQHGQAVSTAIRSLMKHQAFTDAWTCMVALATLNQPSAWVVDNFYFDFFICHVWHSRFVYAFGLGVSIYNLVLTAMERYVATVYPLMHNIFIKTM